MSKTSVMAFGLPVAMVLAVSLSILSCGKNTSPKFKQYYVQGQKLYMKHCANCHQEDGQGLGRVYPPLHKSDFMEENFNDVICLMRYGISGEVFVNGDQFNQPMPGVSTLSDLEVAQIATYIYNSWSHERGIVEVQAASVTLDSCEAKP